MIASIAFALEARAQAIDAWKRATKRNDTPKGEVERLWKEVEEAARLVAMMVRGHA